MDSSNKESNVAISERGRPDDAGSSAPDTISNIVRTRRIFSFYQIFAFSLTYMALWEGMCTNMYFAIYQGGPQVFIWSFVIVFFGALAQSASLAEMASIIPIAGAQYHWTWHLAPPKYRRFATYMQGWMTWFGFVSLLAGIANVTIIILQALISLNHPSYGQPAWSTVVLIIVMCGLHGIINTYSFRTIPWLETVAGVLHVCLFVIFVAVLAARGAKHDAKFVFTETVVSSGWSNDYVAWNLGALTCVWSFTGFDGAIHMSEEVRRAKLAVPRGIFWSIFVNGVLGFIMVILLLLNLGDIEDVLAGNPIIVILSNVTGSGAATTAMVTGIFVISFAVNLANIASVSRLTWAWARDGGLPEWLAYVHPRHRVPVRAIWLTVILVCLLSLLNLNSGTYVAFEAITSLSSLALYISYSIAIGSMLYSRFTKSKHIGTGQWSLGRSGTAVNVFALVYTLYMIIWLPFPGTISVTGTNMNYAGPVMVLVFVVALGLWFLQARRHWEGPNITIMDYVVSQS